MQRKGRDNCLETRAREECKFKGKESREIYHRIINKTKRIRNIQIFIEKEK